uniref:Penicillopepsin-1 n=1 Tax=Penicillium roqueforti TaxID=5082 RepID=PEPA_PENRO|nr:RecName: Full=Penicillopepsin-1; AltName: Full=Acid protease; AltName: Full=Aspartic protease aspA; Flags: Precursor [Penicillium roqueforti]CAA59972.1 aspartic proteinase [Penicillium roqueforti]
MVVFSQVTVALTCFSAIASAAAVRQEPPQGFTVNQVQKAVPGTRTVNLPGLYANALVKYGATVPATVHAAAVSGSAITTPEADDVEYLTPVTIGSSTLNLDFDTGSADLWVFSSELTSSQQSGHDVYNVGSLGTKLSGASWSISYGDGSSASGDVYKDTVTVGGVKATGQAVEAAKKISSQFLQDKNNDGLLGMAFSSINTVSPTPQKTFFDTVKSSLGEPLFAVTLQGTGRPWHLRFGYIDSDKYTGTLAYADVDDSDGFWSFTADSYKIGTGAAGKSITGIADTGTTLLLLDSSIVTGLLQEGYPGSQNSSSAGGYIFPCSATLPDFTVTINGYDAVVPGKYINFAPVSTGSSSCYGGIQSNSGIGFSIFGDIFLKSQYVVFDSEGPRLGFAAQA